MITSILDEITARFYSAMKPVITSERLKELLSYDPETGLFTWLVSIGSAAKGTSAGANKDGYRQIMIGGRSYRAARLAWLYMTGEYPIETIDHIDGNRSNDRFGNLREATYSQNNANVPKRRGNKCGWKGVYWDTLSGRWKSQITHGGKLTHIGRFDTAIEAHLAYAFKVLALQGEFARFG